MKLLTLPLSLLLALAPFGGGLRAQITPADDGTNTTVTPVGDRLDIGGGTLSGDGENLFHSFQEFGLSADQIANFLANPQLRNILGRVVGGEASVINGLIQVTGGNPNLYLINPSGVIFGPNARLNVPAAFTVTTANQIGFGNGGVLDVFGTNQYADLVGDPQTFSFVAGESGAILNAGELEVGDGQNLTLLGSTVVNTGRLQTAGGEVIVQAVAGTQNVRISVPGHLVSLELPAEAIASGITAEDLPALLAGGNLPPTGVEVTADGSTTLTATGDRIPTSPGSAIVAGSIEATGETGGRVQILGDRIGLYEAEVSASGLIGDGGSILIGGDFQGNGPTPEADLSYVSPGTAIATDAGTTGNGGTIVVWSSAETFFAGEASARGGSIAGDGGTAEFSSRGSLGFTGSFDLGATDGTPGDVLFDPSTITIVSADLDVANNDVELADGFIADTDGGNVDFIITDAALLEAIDTNSAGFVELEATDSIEVDPSANLTTDEPPSSGAIDPGLEFDAPEIILGADIALEGVSIELIGDVTLTADITLSSGDNDGVSPFDPNVPIFEDFDAAVNAVIIDGPLDGPHNLTIEAGDAVAIVGPIGAEVPLDSLTIDSPIALVGANSATGVAIAQGTVNGPIDITGDLTTSGSSLVLEATEIEIDGTLDTAAFLFPDDDLTAEGNGTTTALAVGEPLGSINLTATTGSVTVTESIVTVPNPPLVPTETPVDPEFPTEGEPPIEPTNNLAAGNVSIAAGADVEVGGSILTTGLGTGDSGQVQVAGANLTLGADDLAGNTDAPSNSSIDTSAIGGDGGDVTLASSGDATLATEINTSSSAGSAGNVDIEVGGNLSIQNGIFAIAGGAGNGGTVAIDRGSAATEPNPGQIDINGPIVTLSVSGDGGDITVENALGDIEIGALSSRSTSGTGGNILVDASAGFLRLTGTNDAIPGDDEITAPIPETSALSTGGEGNGTIALIHGGNGETPFIVGDASTNGSAGALIANDDSTIAEGTFFDNEIVGDTSILTNVVDPPDPGPEPGPEDPDPGVLPEEDEDDIEISLTTEIQGPRLFSEPGADDARTPEPRFGDRPFAEPSKIVSLPQAKDALTEIERATGVRPALIYVDFVPLALAGQEVMDLAQRETLLTRSYERHYSIPDPKADVAIAAPADPNDRLELVLVTPGAESDPVRVVVPDAKRQEMLRLARRFYTQTSNPNSRNYLPIAQRLYDAIIRPILPELEAAEIENLVFILPEGLRLLPVAALHDGDRFLVESYSAGLAPSLSLTDTTYRPIQDLEVFAAGAAKFGDVDALGPLPAVGVEVPAIATQVWRGNFILNEDFTVEEFKARRRSSPTGIVHLATHADFKLDNPADNYIQFFDRRLRLDEVRELGLNAPPVELMVLSACRTAFGDSEIELGFGGLAVQSGVKSAMASLWYVGDTGTLALMTEFYAQLESAPIKADAMRAAQLALLRKDVIARDGQVEGSVATFPLPAAAANTTEDLSHPFYWAAFTMIGNPW